MNVPSLYIETTVVSYYTARPSRDVVVVAHQQITQEWWETILPHCDAYVSPVVVDEAGRGDSYAAALRLESIATFPALAVSKEVDMLAQEYFSHTQIPEKARADAFHLALATVHDIDYLVSWNFAHILAASVRAVVQEINIAHGFRIPVICTPEEAMEI